MSTGLTSEGEPYDLGEFRWVVAAYIKYLIRARLIDEPNFLTKKDLARWGLDTDVSDPLKKDDLLWRARQIITEEINRRFIPRCGSGGVREGESRFNCSVAFFVDYLHDLPAAIKNAQRKKPIVWADLAHWSDLKYIRDELDKLPHPNRVEVDIVGMDVDIDDVRIMMAIKGAKGARVIACNSRLANCVG